MSSCNGSGECLHQCICDCNDHENCSCEHRNCDKIIGGDSEFDIYCKSDCNHNCTLVECHNYRMCRQLRPQWLLNCDNGMCKDCAIMIGRIKFLDKKDTCPICFINKDMIEISCGKHNFCIDCWKNWSETKTQSPLTCPLCRNPIWK